MKQRFKGLIILFLVIALAIGYKVFTDIQEGKKALKLNGYLGGEKINLFEDPEFNKIMLEDHNLEMDYRRSGSLDMITADATGMNYLFPSSPTALELYVKVHGKPKQSETILNTPIVLYSFKSIGDAFVKKGIANVDANGVYFVDTLKLIQLIETGTKWSDLGVTEAWGEISVMTTNPNKSNSGTMFAGLVANMLNGGSPVTQATVDSVNPKIKKLVERLGYMEDSSSVLFDNFLNRGIGTYPIIAGYENQLLEFALANPQDWAQLNGNIIIMYPVPTVWSSHIYIALDEDSKKAIAALNDPKIQSLAWSKHGFRTGVAGVNQDISIFGVKGVAQKINNIINMPEVNSMQKILEYLK